MGKRERFASPPPIPSRLPADRHPWIRRPAVRGGGRPMRGRLRQLASHPFGSSFELVPSFSILISLLLLDAQKKTRSISGCGIRGYPSWYLFFQNAPSKPCAVDFCGICGIRTWYRWFNLRMWKTWRLFVVPVFSKCLQEALFDRLLWNMWNPYLVPMVNFQSSRVLEV